MKWLIEHTPEGVGIPIFLGLVTVGFVAAVVIR